LLYISPITANGPGKTDSVYSLKVQSETEPKALSTNYSNCNLIIPEP